jgi:phage terminase small subunit
MSGSDSEEKTTPKQDTFIQARLAGNSIVASAKIAGVAEKTAHAWLKLPHVQTAYRDAQRQVFSEALSQLMLDADEARSTLKDVMKDPLTPPGVRVRAAQIILEQSVSIHKRSAQSQEEQDPAQDPATEERVLLQAMTVDELDQMTVLQEKVRARITSSEASPVSSASEQQHAEHTSRR